MVEVKCKYWERHLLSPVFSWIKEHAYRMSGRQRQARTHCAVGVAVLVLRKCSRKADNVNLILRRITTPPLPISCPEQKA